MSTNPRWLFAGGLYEVMIWLYFELICWTPLLIAVRSCCVSFAFELNAPNDAELHLAL